MHSRGIWIHGTDGLLFDDFTGDDLCPAENDPSTPAEADSFADDPFISAALEAFEALIDDPGFSPPF